jgi:protein-S-isoprenylcysteine O-methyltransferase Ste14
MRTLSKMSPIESGAALTIETAYYILFWTWVGSETLLQIFMRTRQRSGQLKDRGSLLLLFPVIFASSWIASWYGETHAHTMLGGAHWLKAAGLALLIAGIAVRATAIVTLGRSFSTNVAIRTTQTLRTTGLYAWVRHPSYSGMLLIFLGIGLYERNWVSVAIITIFPIAALLYRIHVEEAALAEAFGAHYLDYKQRTRRLVPGIY